MIHGSIFSCHSGRSECELRHQPAADVLIMEIAADAQLRQLELAGSEHLSRTGNGVVLRTVE